MELYSVRRKNKMKDNIVQENVTTNRGDIIAGKVGTYNQRRSGLLAEASLCLRITGVEKVVVRGNPDGYVHRPGILADHSVAAVEPGAGKAPRDDLVALDDGEADDD
jgi:hypothetical protein